MALSKDLEKNNGLDKKGGEKIGKILDDTRSQQISLTKGGRGDGSGG